MKRIVCTLLFFILYGSLISQNRRVLDSLNNQLNHNPKSISDSTKVEILVDIAVECLNFNPDSGIQFAHQALEISNRNKYPRGIARSNNCIAIFYSMKAEYPLALKYFLAALRGFEILQNKRGQGMTMANLGNIYRFKSEYSKSLDYYFKAIKIYTELKSESDIPTILSNVATTYYEWGKLKEALDYNLKALQLNNNSENKSLEVYIIGNIGNIYSDLGQYEKAFEYYFKSQKLNEELGDVNQKASLMSNIGILYFTLCLNKMVVKFDRPFYKDFNVLLKQAKSNLIQSNEIAESMGNMNLARENYKVLSDLYAFEKNYPSALDCYKKYTSIKDSIFNIEKSTALTQTAMQYEFDKKQDQLKLEQEKKDIKQRNIRNSITTGLIGALIFLVVLYRQRNKIKDEKRRSDELLLNILPEEVAEELKTRGAASARQFEQVTVLFTDFKDFTHISEKLSPEELIKEINECFSAFDMIMVKYGVEKIKTIGDAYMAAGGLPKVNTNHAFDVVNAALEIQDFMNELQRVRMKEGKAFFEIRIGVHTGPVVAGIVGVKKFAYDIWGDTVNTASRMESGGEVGKVNISGETYNIVKEQYNCIYRGKVTAKNKGQIDMYFVSRKAGDNSL